MSGTRRDGPRARAAGALVVVLTGLALAACGDDREPVTVGLVTKQETNPYWVTMREVAQDAADEHDVTLLTATGTSDVDVRSQVEALQEMTEQGVDGILVAPTDSRALLPAIEAAQEAGVLVIAVDTPTDPPSAVDATFATDNRAAGELVGRYARARAEADGLEPRVALLDLAPGIASGEQRLDGFLAGFGVERDGPEVVGSVDTEGDRDTAREGMEQLLSRDPGVNVVYTVNEPAAFGAVEALQAAGVDLDDVVVVSVDGGCQAIKDGVRPGLIDATAQQYPQNMARRGVQAVAEAVRDGRPPPARLDTGLVLVTGAPVDGVESREVPFGVRNCWG
ncbi:substrate-binding domain-containing protein [Thalassiella azotivora]